MAARVTELSIRVYPLVKKFLSHHFDTAPFAVASLGNPYATYLHAQLDRRDHRDTEEPKKYDRLTEKLTIGIADWRGRSFGTRSLSPYRVAAFNDFVRQMFFDKMATEVSIRTSMGQGLRAAIDNYLQRYDITEDELPIKTAILYYYRTIRKTQSHSLREDESTRPVVHPLSSGIDNLVPTNSQAGPRMAGPRMAA